MPVHYEPLISNVVDLKERKAKIGLHQIFCNVPKYADLPTHDVHVPVSKNKILEYEGMTKRLEDEIDVLNNEISSVKEIISKLKTGQFKGEEYFDLQKELNRYNPSEEEQEVDLKKTLQAYNKIIEDKEYLIKIKSKAIDAVRLEKNEHIKECAMKHFPVMQGKIKDKIELIMEKFYVVLEDMKDLTSTVKGMNNIYQSLKSIDVNYESEYMGLFIYAVLNEYMQIVNGLQTSKYKKINAIDEIKPNAMIYTLPQ